MIQLFKKKNINLGMAAALPDGNLIVPVIKNADQLNLVGMTKQVNDLANRARANQLKPDEIQDGTYTVTNVGSFGSIMGTPIIQSTPSGNIGARCHPKNAGRNLKHLMVISLVFDIKCLSLIRMITG